MMTSTPVIAGALATLVVVIGCALFANRPRVVRVDAPLPESFPEQGFSHGTFEKLLRTYVDGDGHVDYQAWHASADARSRLDRYLAAVGKYSPENAPERFEGRHDRLAYWIYGYNGFVIKAILDRWPLGSVTDVKAPLEVVKGLGFFYQHRYVFGGLPYSLYAVENDKIRAAYRDARIHFVLNCGSESCPPMRPDLPTGEGLEPFLQQAAVDFVSEPRNVHVDHANRRIVLSAIFKWYEKDFLNDLRHRGLPSDGGLRDYIASVAPPALRREIEAGGDYEVTFAEYDWSLNDTAQPGQNSPKL